MAPKKKPITSADLGAVVASAAAGAKQALAKGDLNGASVAMLTLSMAVANPSMGGAASGAHVPSSAAASAVPAAAEVLTAALERAAAVEREGSESGASPNDDALRAAVEAASISAGCLSALHFVLNDSSTAEDGASSSSLEVLEPLAALSRRLLEKIALEFSERSGGGGGGGKDGGKDGGGKDGGGKTGASNSNPWTAKGTLNNAASFAAALLERFYGNRVVEEGEELEAAARDEEDGDGGGGSELVVVSPQALTSILDAAAVCGKKEKQQESIRLLAVDLACAVTSSSAGSGEKLVARPGRREEGEGGAESGGGDGSDDGAPVVAALARLLGSISPSSSSDFAEVRVRSLMALAMTMSAELRLDERKAKKEEEEKKAATPSSSSASSSSAPGARARAALISAPGAPAALVAAMKQSQDTDAKAVARGLFEEVARAEDSKAEMVAALERASSGVAKLALA